MDKLMKDFKGQKETIDLNKVLSMLFHMNDIKVTYTNGFHVSTSLTRTDQIFLDEAPTRRDYENFMKSCQPVINEKALVPN